MSKSYFEFDEPLYIYQDDAPKTLEDLSTFSTSQTPIKDERIVELKLGLKEKYALTNYGRLLNVTTKKLSSLFSNGNKDSAYNIAFKPKETNRMSILNAIRKAFYPESIYKTHINVRFKDGNIFNLRIDNIIFLENNFYEDTIAVDEKLSKPIIFDNEITNFIIYAYSGKVVNINTGKEVGSKKLMANDDINLKMKDKKYHKFKRYALMAQAFIPNPNHFRYSVLIDSTKLTPSLKNICWTDRNHRIST